MSVPAKKRPRSEKRKRAWHFAIKPTKGALCPKCQKPKKPHYACPFCGTYKGKEILKSKIDKKELKKLNKQKTKSADKQQA